MSQACAGACCLSSLVLAGRAVTPFRGARPLVCAGPVAGSPGSRSPSGSLPPGSTGPGGHVFRSIPLL
eukprot:7085676-Lingulodinium_polyedra.AAC.1